MGFALLAWDSDDALYEVDDDDEGEGEGGSVARLHTINTSSASSISSVSSSGRNDGSMSSTTPWGSAGGRSKWPSLSSNSRPSTVDTSDPTAKGDSCKKCGRDTNSEGGQKMSKGARKGRNKAKNARAQAQAQEQAAQASLLAALDVELPPGGPGSSWGDLNEAW